MTDDTSRKLGPAMTAARQRLLADRVHFDQIDERVERPHYLDRLGIEGEVTVKVYQPTAAVPFNALGWTARSAPPRRER